MRNGSYQDDYEWSAGKIVWGSDSSLHSVTIQDTAWGTKQSHGILTEIQQRKQREYNEVVSGYQPGQVVER
jgi:hypothetical protein